MVLWMSKSHLAHSQTPYTHHVMPPTSSHISPASHHSVPTSSGPCLHLSAHCSAYTVHRWQTRLLRTARKSRPSSKWTGTGNLQSASWIRVVPEIQHTINMTYLLTSTFHSSYLKHMKCYECLIHHHPSIKSLYPLCSTGHPFRASMLCGLQLSPWPRSMISLCTLSHPLLPFTTFSSACLSFYIPEDSNLMHFSLLLLFLYVMCVQSNSIFFFLSDFLLTSDGWFSLVLRS